MRSVFHGGKTLSTVVTKQVSYQIFICIFRLRVTSPHVGIRLWGTEGRLFLQSHIHSNTSSTSLLNKTNNCYLFSVINLFFQTPCHQFYRKEPVIYLEEYAKPVRLPQLYYIKMKISYDLVLLQLESPWQGNDAITFFYLSLCFSVPGVFWRNRLREYVPVIIASIIAKFEQILWERFGNILKRSFKNHKKGEIAYYLHN